MKASIMAGCVAGCVAIFAGCGGGGVGSRDLTVAFVGTWNYDQPDRQTGAGVGQVICPATDAGPGFTINIPQIGDLVITKLDDHRVLGKTDQGCSWTFTVDGGAAALDPPTQTCANHVINSSYTLGWTMNVDGVHETEVITGTSHLPNGDCDFELAVATRTKVDPGESDPTERFVGAWNFDPPDPQARVNLMQSTCPDVAGGPPQVAFAPVTGHLVMAKSGDHVVAATSDDGCTFTLAVQGNTAELAPIPQMCHPSGGGAGRSVSFWSMASDGRHAAMILGGASPGSSGDCATLLSAGSLSR